jgi:hypothetical protein
MGRRRKLQATAPDIEQVRELVEQWRKARTAQTRMPEEIWTALVPLARAHGVYGVGARTFPAARCSGEGATSFRSSTLASLLALRSFRGCIAGESTV